MNRIEGLASLVDKDALVLDIGTDHCYLPIYLYEKDITKRVIGSDISKNALEYAKNNLIKHNLEENIKLVLSDGFKNIYEDVDIAVISGVGTNTIKKILDNRKLPNKLVISSHKDLYDLRCFMQSINYKIVKEIVVKENNIYYNLIKYEYGLDNLDSYELLMGLSNDLEYQEYLLKKYEELYKKSDNQKYLNFINIIKRRQD